MSKHSLKLKGTNITIPDVDRFVTKARQFRNVGRKYAVMDWDGTVSRLREGWQNLMLSVFMGALGQAGLLRAKMQSALKDCMRKIDELTGRPTYFQMLELEEMIKSLGAKVAGALNYKKSYINLLDEMVKNRLDELHCGKVDVSQYLVPGSKEFLKALKETGVEIYFVTGSDEESVREELRELGISKYCTAVAGARDTAPRIDAKAVVIENLITDSGAKPGEIFVCGDGFVEMELGDKYGFAVGVCTQDDNYFRMNQDKTDKLIRTGADILIPDFESTTELVQLLKNPLNYATELFN